MRWRPQPTAVLLAVLLALGPAALVQLAAWGAMLAERVPRDGLVAATLSTFAGDDPCRMCLAARQLRAAEGGERPSGLPAAPALKKAAGDLALLPPPLPLPAAADGGHLVPCHGPVRRIGERPSPEPPPPRGVRIPV